MTFNETYRINMLPSITVNKRMHWAELYREKKNIEKWMCWAIGVRRPAEPLKKAKLTCVRFSSVQPDFDNLATSFKHCVDCLVKFKVLENDKPVNLPDPAYRWEKVSPGNGFIEITVEVAA